MVCNELDAGKCRSNKKRELDEVDIRTRKSNKMREKTTEQKNTRELHLERVGNKVTYVRVY